MNSVNRNPETGVRYGYISANSLHPDVVHELQMCGTDVHWENVKEELVANFTHGNLDDGEDVEDDFDDELDRRIQELADNWYDDEPVHTGVLEGVKYRTSWLGGALHVWIFDSPRTALFEECSPCVPGAGNLDCPSTDGVLTYDVPLEWRATE